jgi:DNA-binding response OmpR family regulator
MSERGRLLLIVEDHESTRRMLGSMFGRRGWTVYLATTIGEAWELLNRGLEPDTVILDLGLPDGDGDAVLRKIRECELSPRVVVYTGADDSERLGRIRRLHPDMLLFKPIDSDIVVDVCEAGSLEG